MQPFAITLFNLKPNAFCHACIELKFEIEREMGGGGGGEGGPDKLMSQRILICIIGLQTFLDLFCIKFKHFLKMLNFIKFDKRVPFQKSFFLSRLKNFC